MQRTFVQHNSEGNLTSNLYSFGMETIYRTLHQGGVESYHLLKVHGSAEGWYVSLVSMVAFQGFGSGYTIASCQNKQVAVNKAIEWVKTFYPEFFKV